MPVTTATWPPSKAIADCHNLCMILVHHLRKLTDSADPFNEVSGSTALMGAADTTYLLKKSNRAEEEAVLLATGRDIEYQQLTLRFENYRWTLVERKDSAAIQRDDVPPFLSGWWSLSKHRAAMREAPRRF